MAGLLLGVAVERFRNAPTEDEAQHYLLNFLEILDCFPAVPTSPVAEAILSRYDAGSSPLRQL